MAGRAPSSGRRPARDARVGCAHGDRLRPLRRKPRSTPGAGPSHPDRPGGSDVLDGCAIARPTMSFAAALSEHPLTAQAVGEVAGQILEKLGTGPDLALLFVTPPHAGALEDAAKAVQAIIKPATLLGCAAIGVVGNGQEVE